MKAILRVVILLTTSCISQAASATANAEVESTPVQKVIQMMKGMLQKGSAQKHGEQVQFAAYQQFCDDTKAEKTKSIEDAEDAIEVLEAEINKLEVAIEALADEIAQHDGDIAAWDGDMKTATKDRTMEKDKFQALHADYTESINALDDAIQVMKKQDYDRAQTPALFIQLMMKLKDIPAEARKVYTNFLASTNADGSEAPEANAYEFQSSEIVNMLENLKKKFFGERLAAEKEEADAKLAYDNLMSLLRVQTGQATRSKEDKMKTKAKKSMLKAQKEGDKTSTIKSKEDDTKYLKELTSTCDKKAADFKSRQALREEELEALSQAIKIISGDDVAGTAKQYLPGLLQKKSTSLAHLRGEKMDREKEVRNDMVSYLKRQASHLHSDLLSTVASKVAADPFAKVTRIIHDMIQRLQREAVEEASQKGWCDQELASNKQTREDLTDEISTLKSDIDGLAASINSLGEQIALLSKQVTDLNNDMKKATELRTEEKYKNEDTIKDAQDAQTAVAQALSVLKTFYTKAESATALVQSRPASFVQATHGHKQTPPAIFEDAYKGQQGESGGVVGMLEVIASDFARLEAETRDEEVVAVNAYDQFMADSTASKTTKETTIETSVAQKQNEELALSKKQEDLASAQTQMEAALAYFDKLKPQCVDENVNFEDRRTQRNDEIESLQTALKILSGQDIA